jgi:Pyruvate/2-oxoacid:ferredoxin oxidoreductase gamma subunit
MSNATEAVSSSGGAQKVSRINEVVIRIAGNSQDGIQAIGGFLARLAGRSEQEVMTFMTIPSTISGGPSIFQVRVGSGEVLTAGDDADVLLCFYQHSYEGHINSLKKKGIVLYDSDHVVRFPAKSNTVQDGGAKHVADAIAKTVLAAAPTKRCQVVPLDLIVTNFFEIVKMPNCRR